MHEQHTEEKEAVFLLVYSFDHETLTTASDESTNINSVPVFYSHCSFLSRRPRNQIFFSYRLVKYSVRVLSEIRFNGYNILGLSIYLILPPTTD